MFGIFPSYIEKILGKCLDITIDRLQPCSKAQIQRHYSYVKRQTTFQSLIGSNLILANERARIIVGRKS